MKTVKMNKEQFTQEQFNQINSLLRNLDLKGYNPSVVSQSETHVTIQHEDEDENIIKMMLVSRQGQLTGVEL